ncbi:MAG: hypothetical protein K6E34_13685, partial [Lachnospiraceae bacterium]|nr:hypothetical protein [Lachnospiraceae bacterium]
MIVDGVKVSVTAPEGVFPKGALLKVKKVSGGEELGKIEKAVREDVGLTGDDTVVSGEGSSVSGDSSEDGNSGENASGNSGNKNCSALNLISFDITITDVSGNEIQPKTEEGEPKVTFSQAEIVSEYIQNSGEVTDGVLKEESKEQTGGTIVIGGDDENAGTKKTLRVYHFDDSFENAEKLESQVDEGESAVAVSATHFSTYTIAYATSKTFSIAKRSLTDSDASISLSATSFDYTGSAIKPTVTVKYGTETLTENTDYTLTYANNINEGTATVTVTGTGLFKDAVEKSYTIAKRSLKSSSASVSLNYTDFAYTGSEVKPTVTVKYKTTTLTENTDYTLTFANNVNEGTGTVTVTGTGLYKDSVVKSFTIAKRSIEDSKASVELVQTVVQYTGSAVKPGVVVTYGTEALTENKDYKLTYSDNVNIGNNAKVTVTGAGVYSGTVTKTFKIKNLPSGSISILDASYDILQTEDAVVAYVNSAKTATVTADSKAKEIKYYVSDTFFNTCRALEKYVGNNWKTYSSGSLPTLVSNKKNYIYAKLIDSDSDANYISTKCIIEDEVKPTATVSSASIDGTTITAKVIGSDTLSGVAKYYVMVKPLGESAPDAATIKSSGVSNTTGQFTISSLSTGTSYMVYGITEDKAGNVSTVSSLGCYVSLWGKIEVMDHTYEVLQGKQIIDDYTNEMQEITIEAGGGRGIASVKYVVSGNFMTSTTQIEKNNKYLWSTYNSSSKPGLKRNMLNYIYVRITDSNSNTLYLSTKGIWEDEKA